MKLHFKSAQFQLCAVGFAVAVLAACGSSGTTENATVPTTSTVAADFSINGVSGTVSGQNVTIDLSASGNCATSVESMVVGIQANGATISPDPSLARDYSVPVQYTITSPDGKTQVVYTVTVIGAACIAPTPTPTPTPTACTAAPIGATGYSLVFKGCGASNVAEYYDKTECVRDNTTGLIWEGKPTSGDRASTKYFHNFDDTTKLQFTMLTSTGSPATGNLVITYVDINPTQAQIDSPFNSMGYIKAVNSSSLCGFTDWKRPSPSELLALVKVGTTPTIDATWFPNTIAYHYWTDSPSLISPAKESLATTVNFATGAYQHWGRRIPIEG